MRGAQHALREGKVIAQNITAVVRGKQKRPFVFATIGQLAAIGRRTGVANILGINFSGFIAWWLWRTIYLSKMPRFEKKFRVALDWTLDLLFSKDIVQFLTVSGSKVSHVAEEASYSEFAGETGKGCVVKGKESNDYGSTLADAYPLITSSPF